MPTIFIVEDNPATRELLVEFLEGHGHTVLEAGTALEALTVAAAAAPESSSWTCGSRTPTGSTSPNACGRRPEWPVSPSSP